MQTATSLTGTHRTIGSIVLSASGATVPAPAADAPASDPLAAMARLGTTARFRKGQNIVCEGEASERCFQVVRGAVRLYKMLPDGRRQIVDFVFQDEIFGLAPDEAYGYSADAVTDAIVQVFASATLERLARDDAGLARSLRTAAYRELRAAQAHLVLLGRKTAFERVASFLLDLSRRAARNGHDGSVLWVPMSQADIADYLGLTTETVNRIVAQLRDTGLVTSPTRGVMRLEDRAELQGMACAA